MSKSIIQQENFCYLCGANYWLEEHHVFGAANRKLSEHYGLKVKLCHYCHNEPPNGVHHNATVNNELKARVQKIAMEKYGWTVEDFIRIFGKNYLD